MMEFEFPKYNLDLDFDDDTGFPFDDHLPPTDPTSSASAQAPPSGGSSSSSRGDRGEDSRLRFENHLRNIAARYPEFADHIRPAAGGEGPGAFPRDRVRRDPWGRDEFDFGREFDLPEGFGVDSARFHRPREFYPPNTQTYSSSPPFTPESRPPVYPQPAQATATTAAPKPQAPPLPTQPKPPPKPTTAAAAPPPVGIQQSNTVDLGQVQQQPAQGDASGATEAAGRGQRSMSAPPTNGATGKRYVSSIQIPVGGPAQGHGPGQPGVVHTQQSATADMGGSNSAPRLPPQSQPGPNKPHEYVIPIHIEGRDEPIIPKQQTIPQQQNSQPYMQQQPSGAPQTQPLFNTMKDQYKQQQEQVEREQRQKYYEQKEQEENEAPAKAPVVSKPTPLQMIQLIQKDVSELMGKVEKFAGKPRDKEYIYLDEMLTRNLLKLDNIETEGKDAIRQARREAIKCIEGCIGILEAKANQNAANDQMLAIEDKTEKGEEVEVQKSASGSNKGGLMMEKEGGGESGGDDPAKGDVSKT